MDGRPKRSRSVPNRYTDQQQPSRKKSSNAKSSNAKSSNAKSSTANSSSVVAKSKPKSAKGNYAILIIQSLQDLEREFIKIKARTGDRTRSREAFNNMPSKVNLKTQMQGDLPRDMFWEEEKFNDALAFLINSWVQSAIKRGMFSIPPQKSRLRREYRIRIKG